MSTPCRSVHISSTELDGDNGRLYDGHHGASMSAFLDENLHNLVFSSLELFDDTDEGLRFAFSQVGFQTPHTHT
jgi:hypothetical protein